MFLNTVLLNGLKSVINSFKHCLNTLHYFEKILVYSFICNEQTRPINQTEIKIMKLINHPSSSY